jgi:NADH dehydrogenase [ubiquinone] 1 alpha subcomplex assembly factor 5
MEHIQQMGEGNANWNRQFHVGKDTFLATAAIYQHLYGLEDGTVPATFQIISFIGWAPDQSQPKACSRGSAQRSLKDLENKKD